MSNRGAGQVTNLATNQDRRITMTATLECVTSATRYPDPRKRWEITRRAMRLYLVCTGAVGSYRRETYTAWIDSLEPAESDWQYSDRLTEVRDYAVDECNDGTNCLEGTNEFLRTFGLEEIDRTTRKEVTVSVTITFTVENDADADATRDDVERYLRVDVSGNVDDMDDNNVDVSIDSVEVDEE